MALDAAKFEDQRVAAQRHGDAALMPRFEFETMLSRKTRSVDGYGRALR
jgi:hypothetical protein